MRFLRTLRGALGVGLTWGVLWAFTGLAVGAVSLVTPFLPWHYVFNVFDAPLPALALPGFIGGVIFALILTATSRRRRLTDFSLKQFALLGAAGGVLLSLVPAGMVGLGLATETGEAPFGLLLLTLVIGAPFALLGAGSAAGSLWLARLSDLGPPTVGGRDPERPDFESGDAVDPTTGRGSEVDEDLAVGPASPPRLAAAGLSREDPPPGNRRLPSRHRPTR